MKKFFFHPVVTHVSAFAVGFSLCFSLFVLAMMGSVEFDLPKSHAKALCVIVPK